MSTTQRKVAERVRTEARRQNVTQAEIAALLGRSQAHVSRKMRGLYPFDVAELEAIALRLGVPVAVLIADPVLAA